MSIYLDYNASAPIDDRVLEKMIYVYKNVIGNADSRTHDFGDNARKIVEDARGKVASILGINKDEVFFTSGATESNNIVIQGLEEYGRSEKKMHIITTAIEHKAVLETAKAMQKRGFEVDFITPGSDGRVSAEEVLSKVREDTLLVSVMHVNNETGVIQPVKEIGDALAGTGTFFHVDATQSFGKLVDELKALKYDMMSMSAHKLGGPQGVGGLILRKKHYKLPPIKNVYFGGQQERGIRPGTEPVALIAGFGMACEIAEKEFVENDRHSSKIKELILEILNSSGLQYEFNGTADHCVSSSVNISIKGVSSEALMLATKQFCSISNGSACNSNSYKPSYVLEAMGLSENDIKSSIRISWGPGIDSNIIKEEFEKTIQIARSLVLYKRLEKDMFTKYEILVNVLDYICNSSPSKYDKYKLEGKKDEEINQNRALAYIHLFLLVKFGIQSFDDRFDLITDGSYDGGLDAYYIDRQERVVYLIQSKFRIDEENYENKDIAPAEIASMELKRILEGEEKDAAGNDFNWKIRAFQKVYQELDGRALYTHKVILLANLKRKDNQKTTKVLLDGFDYEVFDYERAYEELVYPYCSSTYFQNGEIIIEENLEGKIDTSVTNFEQTSFSKCTVTLLFVPAVFIAKIVQKYKNSILLYNPRNYLSMSKNSVNKAIKEGIEATTEDFALMNNGITMVCSRSICSPLNGLKDSTSIRLENPQIINGGQTAFTLSRLMEAYGEEKLSGKKVLLKIISTYLQDKENSVDKDKVSDFKQQYINFINCISNATNYQTKIEGPDRRSNMLIQIEFQTMLYKKYGLLYERKAGEFEEALHQKIIKRDQIIPRDILFRSITAIGGESSKAMNDSKDALFSEENVSKTLDGHVPMHLVLYAYLIYSYAKSQENGNKKKPNPLWGNGVKYGKYAIVTTAGLCLKELDICKFTYEQMKEFARKTTLAILSKWNEFEKEAKKKKKNSTYFDGRKNDYVNYYKNNNSRDDIISYWESTKLSDLIDTVK